jgi:hypothetical protein
VLAPHIRQGPRGLRWCVPFPITGIHVLTWFHEYRPTVVLLASMLIRHARGSTGNAAAFLGKTRVGWHGRSRVRAQPRNLMPAKRPCPSRGPRDADKEPGRTGRSRLPPSSFILSIPSLLCNASQQSVHLTTCVFRTFPSNGQYTANSSASAHSIKIQFRSEVEIGDHPMGMRQLKGLLLMCVITKV